MRLRIGSRIFFAVALTSIATLVVNAAVTRWSFQQGFLSYIEAQEAEQIATTVDALAALYAADSGWQALRGDRQRWHTLLRANGPRLAHRPRPSAAEGDRSGNRPGERPREGRPPPPRGGGPRAGRPPPPHDPRDVGRRFALVDTAGTRVVGGNPVEERARAYPVNVDGLVVGTLLVERLPNLSAPGDQNFAREQRNTAYLTLAIAVLIAAGLSAFLARQFTRPIRSLAAGAHAISDGKYETRIPVDRQDELGDLARDFNQLSETLQENRKSRQRWTADIAHELRTPLSIVRGELDAIEDGVRPFNETTLKSLQAEVGRLGTLVSDLRELADSDEGRLTLSTEPLDVVALLRATVGAAEPRLKDAGLMLVDEIPDTAIHIDADAVRLEQLFGNLIENSLRYTDSPGRLAVSCEIQGNEVVIDFRDSAPGVPDHAMPSLFERLYRVEESRSRQTGGSGLGLSICEAIVEAHNGNIAATHSDLGGLCVSLRFPLSESTS